MWQCPDYSAAGLQMGNFDTNHAAWAANDGSSCPDFGVETCLASANTNAVSGAVSLMALRGDSLKCLERRTILGPNRATQMGLRDAMGRSALADNEKWQEFDPSCVRLTTGLQSPLDAITVQLAEPNNALSNDAFDHIACDAKVPSWGKEAATMLGFGSFAFHAAGGFEYSGLLDDIGMKVLITTMFAILLDNTGTSQTQTITETDDQGRSTPRTYNIKAVAEAAVTRTREAYTTCSARDISPEQELRNVLATMPAYRTVTALMSAGLAAYCYPDQSSSPMALLDMLGIDNVAPILSFRLTSPKPLAADSHTNANEVCYNYNRFLIHFICATFVQEDFSWAILEDRHDYWHQRVSLATRYGFRAFDAIKP